MYNTISGGFMKGLKDYPETYEEFLEWFKTEDDCIEYISKHRWPEGFKCSKCNSLKAWRTRKGLMHCSNCGHQTSVIAQTVFQGTRKPLRLWFSVIWWVVSQKTGSSALNLKNAMNFNSYETAWTWLQKLRRIMIRPGRELLCGRVEVDDTYIGGQESGVIGREIGDKILVAVAVEGLNGKIGRVRFRCINNASSEELIPFIIDNVDKNSLVITDGWRGYSSLKDKGYKHEVKNISKSDKDAGKLLPRVHLIIALVKRWLMGTHQGAVSQKHLQYYLDEFSFRFNRRLSTHRGKLFYRIIQQAVVIKAETMDSIIGKKAKHYI